MEFKQIKLVVIANELKHIQ